MSSDRRIALITGVLFIITFAASIPAALFLYDRVLHDPNYVIGPGNDWMVSLGALLEFITGFANIGTAVVLYPLLKRQNETIALGYVASRTVESAFIVVGAFCLLSIVSLRQGFAASPGDTAAVLVVAKTLVAFHDWTFLLGPGFLAAIGNGMMLGYLMYTSGLVPRGLALFGLIGGPLLLASGIATLFGVHEQVSLTAFLMTIPEIIWEGSLGIWLTVHGFSRSSPLLAAEPRQGGRPDLRHR